MKPIIIEKLEKDKLLPYLKQNTHYIKKLNRDITYYETFKKEIKEKYNLRITDKVSTMLNDIELVSNIINTIN